MLKVKIIEEKYPWDLEKEVNKFIKTVDVIDIKYCGETNRSPYSISKYSAMVIYRN